MTKEQREKFEKQIAQENRITELENENKVLTQNLEDTEIINKALEKENAELRAKESFVGDQNRKLCEQQQRIEVLEAENTELKETLKTYNGCGDWDNDFHTCRVYLQHEELQKCVEQLTKAKEIMKHLLDWQYDEYKKSETDKELFKVIAEAEQFLNSEVEKCGQ